MADLNTYENYFKIADANQDGKISGAEALSFFAGSDLPKPVLAQIWRFVHEEKTGFLNRAEFYNALRLVSLAQNGCTLTPEFVKSTLSSQSAIKIPPPNIKTSACNNVIWPEFSEINVRKYVEIFQQVDKDRDGIITGQQAKILFLSWEIPREVLKKIFTLCDQDKDGNLSLKEFCVSVYLMERHRNGFSLPDSLPDTILHDETLLKLTSSVGSDASKMDQEANDALNLALAIKASLESARNENFARLTESNNSSTPSAPPIELIASPSIKSVTISQMKEEEIKQEGNNENVNLGTCSICIVDLVQGACIPCGHMAGCMACLQKIKESGGECPFCRSKIERVVKLYAV